MEPIASNGPPFGFEPVEHTARLLRVDLLLVDVAGRLDGLHIARGGGLVEVGDDDRSAFARQSLRRGAAEAIEAVAHGDKSSSKVVGRRIDEIELPKGAMIGAIVLTLGAGLAVFWIEAKDG